MFDLITFELRKIYKNKAVLLVFLIFLAMIALNLRNPALRFDERGYNMDTTRSFLLHHDDNSKFLTGTYHADNYQSLKMQYEYYYNKVKENTYTSTKMCLLNKSDIAYQPLLDLFENKEDTCDRIKDAISAYHSIRLYDEDIASKIEFDIPREGMSISSAQVYADTLTEGLSQPRDYTKLSRKTADNLMFSIAQDYKDYQFYYEPSSGSALVMFLGAMQGKTMHYITILILIGLCALFTKDQQCNVKEEMLTTKNGRKKVINARICASILYGVSVFLLLTLFTFLLYAYFFDLSLGKKSLTLLLYYPVLLRNLFQFTWIYLAMMFLCTIALTIFISLISSFCKHNFSSFLMNLLLLYGPFILILSMMAPPPLRYSIINTFNTSLLASRISGIEIFGTFIPSMFVIFCVYIIFIVLSFFIIRHREQRISTR